MVASKKSYLLGADGESVPSDLKIIWTKLLNSWMRDPRCKHEYLDRETKNWKIEQVSDEEEGESDKHLHISTRSYLDTRAWNIWNEIM